MGSFGSPTAHLHRKRSWLRLVVVRIVGRSRSTVPYKIGDYQAQPAPHSVYGSQHGCLPPAMRGTMRVCVGLIHAIRNGESQAQASMATAPLVRS